MINNNRWRPPALRQPLTDSRDSFVLTVSALGREREGERERARASERERETERARECALSLPTTARGSAAAAPVLDSIIIEGPGVEVPLDYVPAGIYQGRRVWAVPVAKEGQDGQGNGP